MIYRIRKKVTAFRARSPKVLVDTVHELLYPVSLTLLDLNDPIEV